MNKQSITFKADEQELIKTGGINSYASNIVAYIEATFELGENWTGYDSVRAVWSNDYLTDISTVLDPNGRCIVPTEVLTDTGNVTVNLVGSISVDDELTDRLTTYPCKALTVDEDAKVEGDETESITPSQFEQFVSIVHDEVEEVTGMSAEASTLPAGSPATASYSDGVLSLGIPKGADGVDGKDGKDGVTPDIDIGTVETLETGVPAYANITGTVENPSLNLGLPKGNTGDTGATGAPAGFGEVTATIDGTTGTPSVDVTASGADTAKNFAFAFHNLKGEQGEQGEQGDPGLVQDVTVNGTSVVDQNGVAVITLPELVKTVSGNPIVIDDAFGEVKNLGVELLPIQDLHGYSKPWAAGAGSNKYSIEIGDDVWITNASGTTYSNNNGELIINTTASTYSGVYGGGQQKTLVNQQSVAKTVSFDIKGAVGATIAVQNNNVAISTTYQRKYITIPANTSASLLIYGNGTANTIYVKNLAITEDGSTDFTPYSNICPITGHDSVTVADTGKNLFDSNSISLIPNSASSTKYGVEFTTAGTYTVSGKKHNADTYLYARVRNADGTYDATKYVVTNTSHTHFTFTITDGQTLIVYSALDFTRSQTIALFDYAEFQVEYGNTETDYAPYHGQSKTVTLPHTVYGAGVGVTSGNGKDKKGITTFADLIWGYSSADARFYSNSLTYNRQSPNALCSQYQTVTLANFVDGSICVHSNGYIYVKDSRFTDAITFKQTMGSTQLCYELATPTDLSTTPTDITLYNGDNVISSDGDMTMEYVQDMAIVIRKIESQL